MFPSCRATRFCEVEIPLPPLEEQRRIVAEIEGYQKVLDGARQILAGYIPRLDINPEWANGEARRCLRNQTRAILAPPTQCAAVLRRQYPFLQTGDVVRANGGAASHTQTLNELGLIDEQTFHNRPSCSSR